MIARHCVLALLLALVATGCASRQSESVDTASNQAAARTDIAVGGPSLADFEAAMAGVALERAWSHAFFQKDAGHMVETAVVCGNDLLVVTRNAESGEGRLHSIDATRGVHRWELAIGTSPLAQAPSATGGYAVVLTKDGRMQAVNRATGSRSNRSWIAELGQIIPTRPAGASRTSVFVTSLTDDRVHCLDPATGASGWHWSTHGTPIAGPLVTPSATRSLTIVGTDKGEVVALPPRAWNAGRPSEPSWRHRVLDEVSGSLGYGTLTEGGSTEASVFVASRDNGFYCLDAASGEPRWIHWSDKPFDGDPVAVGDKVVNRNPAGLHAFALSNGAQVWGPDSDAGSFERALAGDSGRMYLQKGNTVARVTAATGQIEASIDTSGFQHVLGASEIGLVIGIAQNGMIVAYR